MLVCRSRRKRCLYWGQITVYDELTRSEKILGEESGIGGGSLAPHRVSNYFTTASTPEKTIVWNPGAILEWSSRLGQPSARYFPW